jgi:hypothetical protein
MTKYLSINLQGGLGNQVFQVIATLILAKKNRLQPIFKKIENSPSIFKNRPVYWDSIFKNLDTFLIDNYNFHSLYEILPIDNLDHFEFNTENNYLLNGYFQASFYYEHNSIYINNILHLDYEFLNEWFNENFKEYNNIVSVHVRRGDYVKLKRIYINLDNNYYNKAMEFLNRDNSIFLVFSDDIEWCKKNLDNCYNIYYVTDKFDIEKELSDFILMSKCSHNIIANSSFSWCASLLNSNPDKKIVAPRKFFIDDSLNKKYGFDKKWIIL